MKAKKIGNIILIALLTICLVGFSGCIDEDEETIRIGAIYPLTGSLAITGADVQNGILLAVDIINNYYDLNLTLARSKGIGSLDGTKIEIVFGDSEGSSSIGELKVKQLINEEKVVALLGSYQSTVTNVTSEIAEDEGIPFLTALSTAPMLTERGLQWFFRTTPHDETFIRNFFEFLQDIQEEKNITLKRIAIVYEDSLWGTEFAEYCGRYARDNNYLIVANVSYPAAATNVNNETQRLKDAHPDVVMQASYVNDAILYMQTYNVMNFSPDGILANGVGFVEPQFIEVLGDAGNYILTRTTWSNDLVQTKPLVGTISNMFFERYGTEMTGNSARAFTGMLVLADAIDRAGSTEPNAIREALLETNISSDNLVMPWNGVKFDHETHQNMLGGGIICQIINQEYCTIWPLNLATKDLIWPIPR